MSGGAGLPPFETLASDGVVSVRAFREEDVPAIVEACRDPEVVRWTRVPEPYEEDDARGFLAYAEASREDGTELACAIAGANGGEYLGSIGLRIVERDARGDIGYFVAPWARRRGVAVSAVRLLADHGFRKLGLGRIEIATHPDNVASQGVAEKAGFARDALLRSYTVMRDGRHDAVLFSRIA